MLIPLTLEEARERAKRHGISEEFMDAVEEHGKPVYTCRHWDETTRECGIYDSRPDMCASYPYANDCWHCGSGGDPDYDDYSRDPITVFLGEN